MAQRISRRTMAVYNKQAKTKPGTEAERRFTVGRTGAATTEKEQQTKVEWIAKQKISREQDHGTCVDSPRKSAKA